VLQDKAKPTGERKAAAERLRELRADARDAVPALARASDLMADDWSLANSATRALESLGPAAKAAVPELTKRLKDGHLSVKMELPLIFRAMGPAAADALPPLLATMQKDSPDDHEGLTGKMGDTGWSMLRVGCAGAVAAIGGKKYYPQVVDTLIELFKGKQQFAAYAAFGVLRDMEDLGPAGVPAIPILIRGLQKGNSDIKANAAIALGNIGPAAKEAVPALEKLVGDYYTVPRPLRNTRPRH